MLVCGSFRFVIVFVCLAEANIGSEDSSLSDALVLDDGEFCTLLYTHNNFIYYLFINIYLIFIEYLTSKI